MDDFDGRDVFDTDGNKIGTVERTFVDERGTVRFVEVTAGTFMKKRHFIPADNVERTDEGIQIGYSKDDVSASPSAPANAEDLSGETLHGIVAYYDRIAGRTGDGSLQSQDAAAAVPVHRQPTDDSSQRLSTEEEMSVPESADSSSSTPSSISGGQIGQVRELGDVIEVPILGERMVKEVYVREILRVRKSEAVTKETIRAQLRKEEIEVDADPDVVVRDNT